MNKKKPKKACKKAKRACVWDQKKCLEHMVARYGTQVNHVEVDVYMTAHEVKKYYGPMCEEYEPLCACCQAWLQWNQKGTVPVLMDRDEVLKVIGL